MGTIPLRRRLTAVILCLALAVSMLVVPAAAAKGSPSAHLSNVGYLGTRSKCVMDATMAQAYANALKKLPSSTKAILVDHAGDGMPLLMTTHSADSYGDDLGANLKIWTWNGQSASAYPVAKDLDWTAFGYTLGTFEGKRVLRVGDGISMAVGDASGDQYYAIKNGQLSPMYHVMFYSAFAYDGVTAEGRDLPLVQGNKTEWMEYAPVSDLVRAGWSYSPEYYALALVKENGTYRSFRDYDSYSNWHNAYNQRFQPASGKQFLEMYSYGGALLGDWSRVSDMRSALEKYAADAAASQGGFLDVGTSHYAYKPVMWAVDRGITNGTSATTFSPDRTCTQGQILTFLWRAVGQPEPGIRNPFTNPAVTSGQYYYDALLWAYEQGIVTSRGLDPNSGCQRSDVVLYLWRMAGSPAASGVTFSDVSASAPYAKAVAWAVKEGITNGTSATTFSPAKTCTRGQIVTFLYRDLVG